MAKKNKDSEGQNNKEGKSDDSETPSNTIVLKVDLHCEGCATKLVKLIRSSEGVEGVKCEWTASKISVVGEVDPLKLREKIEQKTHKKVEVISPLPKKDKSDGNAGNKSKDKENKEKDSKYSNKKLNDWKKPKELPVTTEVLKVNLHCEGCIQKIQKIATKTKGYKEIKIDRQKDLVTVTGSMDVKSLAANLKKHLKRNVEIVPAKMDLEKKDKGGKKDGGSDQNGGEEKGEKAADDGVGMEGHKMQMQVPYGFPYPPPFNTYGPGFYGEPPHQFHHVQYPYGAVHAPQLFSDENPNACSVM